MVSFTQPNGLAKRPALKQLQEVQEEIYRQLLLLLPDHLAYHDSLLSRVSGSPVLRLEVLEPGLHAVPLELDGVGLRAALLDGEPAALGRPTRATRTEPSGDCNSQYSR